MPALQCTTMGAALPAEAMSSETGAPRNTPLVWYITARTNESIDEVAPSSLSMADLGVNSMSCKNINNEYECVLRNTFVSSLRSPVLLYVSRMLTGNVEIGPILTH